MTRAAAIAVLRAVLDGVDVEGPTGSVLAATAVTYGVPRLYVLTRRWSWTSQGVSVEDVA